MTWFRLAYGRSASRRHQPRGAVCQEFKRLGPVQNGGDGARWPAGWPECQLAEHSPKRQRKGQCPHHVPPARASADPQDSRGTACRKCAKSNSTGSCSRVNRLDYWIARMYPLTKMCIVVGAILNLLLYNMRCSFCHDTRHKKRRHYPQTSPLAPAIVFSRRHHAVIRCPPLSYGPFLGSHRSRLTVRPLR